MSTNDVDFKESDSTKLEPDDDVNDSDLADDPKDYELADDAKESELAAGEETSYELHNTRPETATSARRKSGRGRRRSHWDVRELVTLAIFCALGMALSFIQIPIFPVAPWLMYDPSGIISLAVALMYGPSAGVIVQIISWLPRLIMDPLGTLLTLVAMAGMVVTAGLLYKRWHTFRGAIVSLLISVVPFLILAIVMNIIITPIYAPGTLVSDVVEMLLPIIIPFNLLKCAINLVITILIYKPISNLVKRRDNRSHV